MPRIIPPRAEYFDDAHLRGLSIRHWGRRHIKVLIREAIVLLESPNCCNQPGERERLLRKDNKELFKLLSTLGFFDYHVTNNGRSCYTYQAVLYLKKGWRRYMEGEFAPMGELEIHHIDHDFTNDAPENLAYVTPYENKMLAACIKGGFYFGNVIYHKIQNAKRFVKLLLQTRIATLDRLARLSLSNFA